MAKKLPDPPATKRCAIYTRKSTSEGLDREFNSLDAQRESCARYAQSQGWSLLAESYDDGGFTGANVDRPAFQRLLADIDAGKVDVVVVYKVDRLSRSLLDFAKVMDRFHKAGAAFVSVTQNFSTADAMGRLTLNMLMSFAEFEREMIGERTRDKIAASRRKGKWTGGPVPLGYEVVDRKLVVNELEALIVREVFTLYVEHRSALSVAKELDARGRTTKRIVTNGGDVRPAHRWSKDGVLRVLRNPLYVGLIPYGEERHAAEHAAIVDVATFERVQRLLADIRSISGPGHNPDYFLRGLLRCACAASMTPASTRKGGSEYRYYRCVRRDKGGRDACDGKPLPAGAVEEYVVARLRERVVAPGYVPQLVRKLASRLEHERKALSVEHTELPRKLAKASVDVERLAASLEEVTGPARRVLQQRLEEASGHLEGLRARCAAAEQRSAALRDVEIESAWVAETLGNFDAIWGALTSGNRARLVRALVESVVVDGVNDTIRIELAIGRPTLEDCA